MMISRFIVINTIVLTFFTMGISQNKTTEKIYNQNRYEIVPAVISRLGDNDVHKEVNIVYLIDKETGKTWWHCFANFNNKDYDYWKMIRNNELRHSIEFDTTMVPKKLRR